MDKLTLTCACKTSMVPVETLGEGHFRCPKCRSRVHVSTPFGKDNGTCRISKGNGERCNREAADAHGLVCEPHAKRIMNGAVSAPNQRDKWAKVYADREFSDAIHAATLQRRFEDEKRHSQLESIRPSFVYYVRLRQGCIKIGYSVDVRGRIHSFRVWDPDELLAVEPGGRPTERERHKQFAHLRRKGYEEFDEAPDLMEHIAAVRSGHGDPWQAIDRMRTLARRKRDRDEGRIP